MIASFCCPFKLPSWPISFAFPCPFKGYVTSSWPRSRRLLWDWSWVPGSLRKNDAWVSQRTNPWSSWSNCCSCLLADQCPKQRHCYQPSPWDWLQVGLWRRDPSPVLRRKQHYQAIDKVQAWLVLCSLPSHCLSLGNYSFATICSFDSLAPETALLSLWFPLAGWQRRKCNVTLGCKGMCFTWGAVTRGNPRSWSCMWGTLWMMS